jgi:hypothetical protein
VQNWSLSFSTYTTILRRFLANNFLLGALFQIISTDKEQKNLWGHSKHIRLLFGTSTMQIRNKMAQPIEKRFKQTFVRIFFDIFLLVNPIKL